MDYPIGKKERELIDWISSALERKERLIDRITTENRIISQYEAQLSDAQQRPMPQRLDGEEQ
tara:strand:- start:825 stop:1010 length:186 start_codon:yes stop_codon:yes gene_type:complete